MKILVIVASDLGYNSSANLCHLAYLQGLVELGNEITLLCGENASLEKDDMMVIPKNVNIVQYKYSTIYQKLSKIKKRFIKQGHSTSNDNIKGELIDKISFKQVIRKFLIKDNIYQFESKLIKKASKFKSDTVYDILLSISAPHAAHRIALNLAKNKNVKFKKWIEIWEDPWLTDLYIDNQFSEKIKKEEELLLSECDKVIYVSPLTLSRQKEIYRAFSSKMDWVPLPFYYQIISKTAINTEEKKFGYFGDYHSQVRNISPLYEACEMTNTKLIIRGNPGNLKSINKIDSGGRIPLSLLKEYENMVDVLIILCNLTGGQIPGKVYQYSASNKLVLFIIDGSEKEKKKLKDLFGKLNRFIFCENNVDDIINTIKDINNGILSEKYYKPIDDFMPAKIVEKIIKEN